MYKPRKVDIEWAMEMVRVNADRGLIAFPTTNLFYRMDQKGKKLVLINGNPKHECHLRTIAVFSRVGYSVVVGQTEPMHLIVREMLACKNMVFDEAGACMLVKLASLHQNN